MTVVRLDSGMWAIIEPSTGAIVSTHETNGQACRALDRLQNEPISKREDTADWIARKDTRP